MKTVQEHKRECVERLISEVLKEKKIELLPTLILCKESEDSEYTTVDFSFIEKASGVSNPLTFRNIKGKGFIDCVFSACLEQYAEEYNSLWNLSLVDLTINPDFSVPSSSFRTDAKTDVVLKIKVLSRGEFEFRKSSRSMICSGFFATLSAFQFYINCHKTYDCLILAIEDAKKRGREDIVGTFMCRLSEITTMNNYEKRAKI